MMLLAGAVHAAPIEDALRHYDGGQFEAAAQQLAPLAEGGNPVAQERLAIMYFYGRGVPEDEDKALQWARRSADQGNLDAMYFIGNMYVFGEKLPKSVQDPDQEAARWYFEAARKGHAEAEYGLGLLFLAGKGVVQDQEEAMRWIRSAADHGHPGARSFLGGSKGSGH
ncbi:tetratricopeptide repeat protein [Aromatoleum evansii]|nr:tetratricopeptide repeat protein [Aromatoleum evansii]NMG30703.1 sel1 repeat family protein [Aromatoleum evansii]